MNRAVRFPIVFFLILTGISVLSGCSVISSLRTGYPLWYFHPGIRKSQVAFVGAQTAENRRQAELLAYSEIIDKLSFYLGYEPERSAYRELLSHGKIELYGLSVRKRRIVDNADGTFTSVMLAVAEKSVIEGFRNQDAIEAEDRIMKIQSLVSEGDEYIKQSREVDGLSCYIRSMALSAQVSASNLDEEFSFDEIYTEVLNLLSSVKLEIVSADPAESRCTVSVTRNMGLLYSKVEKCPVRAYFTATDGRNLRYSDSYVFYTSEKGVFNYYAVNPTVLVSGSVAFSINLVEELEELEKIRPDEAAEIRSLIEKKTVIFEYDMSGFMGTVAVSVMDYSALGVFSPSYGASDYIRERFENDGAEVRVMNVNIDVEDRELVDVCRSLFPEVDFLVVIRTGIIETVSSVTGRFVTSMEGRVCLYSIDSSREPWESKIVYAMGFGDDEQSSVVTCRMRIEDILYSLVKAAYV